MSVFMFYIGPIIAYLFVWKLIVFQYGTNKCDAQIRSLQCTYTKNQLDILSPIYNGNIYPTYSMEEDLMFL